MSGYELAPRVEADLNDIQDYIARGNRLAAADTITKIFSLFEKIGEMPSLGHKHPSLLDQEVLVRNIHSYTIIYDPYTKPVSILRVVSGYRDMATVPLRNH